MDALALRWAGDVHDFCLTFGSIIDLQRVCLPAADQVTRRIALEEVYQGLGRQQWSARYAYHIIRLGLEGAGLTPREVRRTLVDGFDAAPLVESVYVAIAILNASMAGIPPDTTAAPKPAGPPVPYDFGALAAAVLQLGVTPTALRAMSYADVVLTMRAMATRDTRGGDLAPPTEEEFEDMLRRLAPELLPQDED